MTTHQALSDTAANSRLISQQVTIECEDAPGTIDPVVCSVCLASIGYSAHVNRRDYAASARGEFNMSVTEISG